MPKLDPALDAEAVPDELPVAAGRGEVHEHAHSLLFDSKGGGFRESGRLHAPHGALDC